ncbi:hypothetical protein MTR_0044s0290 [Medicago truncatula]|uniref:RNA-directed DNA polymerase n=1 Tax=Medicago truncatula TaxID=3880 RepID=G7ZUR2_MEDTR|nr:hypothetical protein MTR_0044s0290 [Medicago truncatula]
MSSFPFSCRDAPTDHTDVQAHNTLSLCGLKQSPRVWFGKFNTIVNSLLKRHLSNEFHTKDLGKLCYFLGIEVACSIQG